MNLKKVFPLILTISTLIFGALGFSNSVWAEGGRSPTNLRNEATNTMSEEATIQHIHNKYGPTAAGMSGREGDVHMKKGEHSAHGHSMHPHTVKGSKSSDQNRKMSALEYRKAMFGSNN